jgi:hypothetical protein
MPRSSPHTGFCGIPKDEGVAMNKCRRFGQNSGLRADFMLLRLSIRAAAAADSPAKKLFRCNRQDHIGRGFTMVFRYA